MSKIAKAVSVIESEFNARESEIAGQIAEAKEQKSKNSKKSRELTAKGKDLDVRAKGIEEKEAYIAGIESVEVMRADAAANNLDAAQMLERAKTFNKESEILRGEARQKLAEQAKRERALNKERTEYKARIQKEVVLEKAFNFK